MKTPIEKLGVCDSFRWADDPGTGYIYTIVAVERNSLHPSRYTVYCGRRCRSFEFAVTEKHAYLVYYIE